MVKKSKNAIRNTSGNSCKQNQQPNRGCSNKIPGIPPDLAETVIQTIKKLGKYYKKNYGRSITTLKTSISSTTPTNINSSKRQQLETIIETKIRAQTEKSEIAQEQDIENVIDSLLQHIQTSMMMNDKSKRQKGTRQKQQYNDDIDVACLSFLIQIIVNTNNEYRPWIQRSALRLSHELLIRSASCRKAFIDEGDNDDNNINGRIQKRIMIVMNSVLRLNTRDGSEVTTGCFKQMIRELCLLVIELCDKFGDLYPHFIVARQYLDQHCPVCIMASINDSDNLDYNDSSYHNMDWYRRGRDQALKYHNKEMARVQKSLDCANTCFEVLVPRFGFGVEGGDKKIIPTNKVILSHPTITSSYKDDDNDAPEVEEDDTDDDIDWEDGDNEDRNNEQVDHHTEELSHADKVERTLAVISVSRSDYTVELNFDDDDSDYEDTNIPQDDTPLASNKAREKLIQLSSKLSTKHLPRLRWWIDSLISADDLSSSQNAESGATSGTFILPMATRKIRKDILQRLKEVKLSIVSTINSSSKLGISPTSTTLQSATTDLVKLPNASISTNKGLNIPCPSLDKLSATTDRPTVQQRLFMKKPVHRVSRIKTKLKIRKYII